MITKRIGTRKDGKSSALQAMRYGEGLKRDRESGELLAKSLRTRLGNFGLVDDGIYVGQGAAAMAEVIKLAAAEMQANCDLNTRVGPDKKIAHFIVSFDQDRPSDAVLRDTEDSMLAALKLDRNHFATFLHCDNGHWHLHLFASRIDRERHLGNALWQDKTIRDRVCREIELRHGLAHDNGMHRIEESGHIVEVPREERRKSRDQKPLLTDRARTTEIHSGAQTFQSWAAEIRLGDRLKHARSWRDLHAAAAAYGCEVKPKGAGFVICPISQKGGIQLSKIGLKNLPARFGAFEPARPGRLAEPVAGYAPSPTVAGGAGLYARWRADKLAFQPARTERINALREAHKLTRSEMKKTQSAELREIRSHVSRADRFAAVSIAKMRHATELGELSERFKGERKRLYADLAAQGLGNTFREYLVRQAGQGDSSALALARKYGHKEATEVARGREARHLRLLAEIQGEEHRPVHRLRFSHHVEPTGTVVYHLGNNRVITDSATARMIRLNDVAAHDPSAISTALRFATLKFGSTLTLTGPAEFQRLAVETAVRERLGIRFADPALEAYREKLAAGQPRRTSIHHHRETLYAPNHRVEQLRQVPPAHLRDRLHNLSLGDLVLDTSRHVGALRQNVPHRVEQPEARGDNPLQRPAGRAGGAGKAKGGPRLGPAAGVSRPGGRDLPLTSPDHATAQTAAGAQTAREWAEEWAKANKRRIVQVRSGDGTVPFKVLYIGPDGGVVLDMGRTLTVARCDPAVVGKIHAGDYVGIDDDGGAKLLQQKSPGRGHER